MTALKKPSPNLRTPHVLGESLKRNAKLSKYNPVIPASRRTLKELVDLVTTGCWNLKIKYIIITIENMTPINVSVKTKIPQTRVWASNCTLYSLFNGEGNLVGIGMAQLHLLMHLEYIREGLPKELYILTCE